jgi:dTDP-4-dehydrorhamnose 3,5-epimerase
MKLKETYLKGCLVLSPKVIEDDRGLFFESFNHKSFEELIGFSVNFIQDNQSVSKKGVLRGLHYQTGAFAQAKLVRVVKGRILDVCIDLRSNSKTFGQHFSIILDDKENQQLYIPRDFAHGFVVLEGDTIFSYKCDNYYNKASESGILYNDPNLNIDWNLPESQFVLSEKDKQLPTFESLFK